ncbi:type II toxin-antitoxin system PemK/MazF family toxin [Pseudonocardia spinosispora]|uniref:type II toxin-antitoxin system PemK/MazF family toxin n=1 Tax=Pseudonocardia spinosispora TaxID=103441 RepID=UPI00040B2C03|nr:type II toxin-antitoxin system PemK/MazF family toxin [Pseudonocardia spinosispora]
MKQGEIWLFERERPSRDNDPRTPYRVIVSADYRLPSERKWVLTAPVVANLDIDTPVAVRLSDGDPIAGWVRADQLTNTFAPWLSGPVGTLAAASLDALAAALRTEMDL